MNRAMKPLTAHSRSRDNQAVGRLFGGEGQIALMAFKCRLVLSRRVETIAPILPPPAERVRKTNEA